MRSRLVTVLLSCVALVACAFSQSPFPRKSNSNIVGSQAAGAVVPLNVRTPSIAPVVSLTPLNAFTDSAGVTKAVAGNQVQYVRDLTVNGKHATQATVASRPIISYSLFAGLPAIEFPPSTTLKSTGAFTAVGAGGWAVFCEVKYNQISGNQLVWSNSDGYMMFQPGTGMKYHLNTGEEAIVQVYGNGTTTGTEFQGITYVIYDGATLKVGINGIETSTAAVHSPQSTGDLDIGTGYGTQPISGLYGEIKVFQAAQVNTAAKILTVCQDMTAIRPCVPAVSYYVGTSLTSGQGLADWKLGHAKKSYDLIGSPASSLYVEGRPGETLVQILADTNTSVYNWAGRPHSFGVFEGGTNDGDQDNSMTAATILSRMVALYNKAISQSLVPIVQTIAARSSSNPNFDTVRIAANALYRQTFPYVVDVGGTAGFQAGDINGANYQVDHIHWTDAANTIVAMLEAPVIRLALSSGALPPTIATGPALYSGAIVGVGTAYPFTQTLAPITFGTTSASIILPAGTYAVTANVSVQDAGSGTPDKYEFQFYNSTDATALGVKNSFSGISILNAIGTCSFTEIITLTKATAVTIAGRNANTRTAGSVIAANTDISWMKLSASATNIVNNFAFWE